MYHLSSRFILWKKISFLEFLLGRIPFDGKYHFGTFVENIPLWCYLDRKASHNKNRIFRRSPTWTRRPKRNRPGSLIYSPKIHILLLKWSQFPKICRCIENPVETPWFYEVTINISIFGQRDVWFVHFSEYCKRHALIDYVFISERSRFSVWISWNFKCSSKIREFRGLSAENRLRFVLHSVRSGFPQNWALWLQNLAKLPFWETRNFWDGIIFLRVNCSSLETKYSQPPTRLGSSSRDARLPLEQSSVRRAVLSSPARQTAAALRIARYLVQLGYGTRKRSATGSSKIICSGKSKTKRTPYFSPLDWFSKFLDVFFFL